MSSAKSIELGRGHVTLGTNDAPLKSGLESAKALFQSWGKQIGILGASVAAVGASISAPFLYGLNTFASWGAEVRSTIRETGIDFERLDLILDGTRVSAEELVPAVAKMSEFLDAAAHGSTVANATLSELNLTIADLMGMTQGERLLAFAEAISRIGDAGTRIARQRDVFGRGGLALNLAGGRQGIQARADRMDVVEGVRTQADLAAANAYNAAFKEMRTAISAFWYTVGAAAAPAMAAIYRVMTEIVIPIRRWVEEHRTLASTIFHIGLVLIGLGAIITTLGTTIYVAGIAFGAVRGVMLSVAAAATSVGGALALIQYGAMIVGLGTVTNVALAARVAFYGFKLALFAASAAVAAWNFVIGIFQGVAIAIGAVETATFLMGMATKSMVGTSAGVWLGHAIAVKVAAAATLIYHAGLMALMSGLGVFTAIQAVWGVGAAANSAIATAALWIYAGAVAAVQAILWALGAAYWWVFVSEMQMTAGEMIAWLWTTILSSGINLLVASLVFLEGALILVIASLAAFVLVLGGGIALIVGAAVAIGMLGIRFGEFHRALTFLDDIVDWLAAIPGYIHDMIDSFVIGPIVSFYQTLMSYVQRVIDFFVYLRDMAIRAYESVRNLFAALSRATDSSAMEGIGTKLLYAAVGIAALTAGVIALTYRLAELAYEFDLRGAIEAGLIQLAEFAQQTWNDAILAIQTQVRSLFSGGLIERITTTWQAAVDYVRDIWDRWTGLFVSSWNSVVGLFVSAWQYAVSIVASVWAGAVEFVAARWRWMVGLVMSVWDGAVAYVVAGWNYIASKVNYVVTVVRSMWQSLVYYVVQAWEGAINAIASLAQNLWSMVVSVFDSIVDSIAEHIADIVNAFVWLRDKVYAVFEWLLETAVDLGRELVGAFMAAFRGIRNSLGELLSAFRSIFDSIVSTATNTWSNVSASASRAFAGWGQMFSSLYDTAQRAFQGIKDAFAASEWMLIWEIVKATFMLAWTQIFGEVRILWNEFKYMAFEVIETICNTLADLFGDSWEAVGSFFADAISELQAMFVSAWGYIESGFWGVAATVIEAWGTVHRFILASLEAIIGAVGMAVANQAGLNRLGPMQQQALNTARTNATNSRLTGNNEAAAIRENRGDERDARNTNIEFNAQLENDERQRLERERLAAQERLQRATREGNAVDIESAQNELQGLTTLAYWARQALPEGATVPGGDSPFAGPRGQVYGSFSAQALFGQLGSRSVSPAERQLQATRDQLRAAEEALRVAQEQLRELREIGRNVQVRVS